MPPFVGANADAEPIAVTHSPRHNILDKCPELRKKRTHYLCFLHYPEPLQPTLSTTNVVEAVNGQLERLRRNNGGYFQSEDNLKLKLAIAMRYLEDGKWKRPCADARACIDQLNALFERRFEAET